MNLVRIGLKTLTGLLSIFVTLHALLSAWAIDLRANPTVSFLYCFVPGLTFFVFLFVRPLRIKALLLSLIAVGYLVTASILNWRTCAELGYCSTVASTVIQTLKTKPVLGAFAVAVLSLIPLLIRNTQREASAEGRRTESDLD